MPDLLHPFRLHLIYARAHGAPDVVVQSCSGAAETLRLGVADELDVPVVIQICSGGTDLREIICNGYFTVIACHLFFNLGLVQFLALTKCHLPARFQAQGLPVVGCCLCFQAYAAKQ